MKKLVALLFFVSLAFGQTPNYFYTYLTSGVASTDTTLTFTATDTTYAGSNTTYYATIWDTWYSTSAEAYKANKAEAILINSRSGNTFDVERGVLGTTARAFNTSGRRYRVDAVIFGTQVLPTVTSGNSGKYLTNDGSTVSWSSAITTDSILAHRTYMGANRDSIGTHRTFMNANRDSVSTHRTYMNGLKDFDDRSASTVLLTYGTSTFAYNDATPRFWNPFLFNVAYTAASSMGTTSVPVWRAPYDGYLYGLTYSTGTNSLNAGCTFNVTTFVNGDSTAQNIVVTGTGSALMFYDTTNTVSISAGQTVYFKTSIMSGGSSGAIGAPMISVMYRRD